MESSDVPSTLLILETQQLMYLGFPEQRQLKPRLTSDHEQAAEGRAGGLPLRLHTVWRWAWPWWVCCSSSRL